MRKLAVLHTGHSVIRLVYKCYYYRPEQIVRNKIIKIWFFPINSCYKTRWLYKKEKGDLFIMDFSLLKMFNWNYKKVLKTMSIWVTRNWRKYRPCENIRIISISSGILGCHNGVKTTVVGNLEIGSIIRPQALQKYGWAPLKWWGRWQHLKFIIARV